MAVKYCHLCDADPAGPAWDRAAALAAGEPCPICYQPTCRRHLSTVRWRWRESGDLDAALICRHCASTYAHRHWDVANREWIS